MGDEADAAVEWYSRSPSVGRLYRPVRRAPKPLVTLTHVEEVEAEAEEHFEAMDYD